MFAWYSAGGYSSSFRDRKIVLRSCSSAFCCFLRAFDLYRINQCCFTAAAGCSNHRPNVKKYDCWTSSKHLPTAIILLQSAPFILSTQFQEKIAAELVVPPHLHRLTAVHRLWHTQPDILGRQKNGLSPPKISRESSPSCDSTSRQSLGR